MSIPNLQQLEIKIEEILNQTNCAQVFYLHKIRFTADPELISSLFMVKKTRRYYLEISKGVCNFYNLVFSNLTQNQISAIFIPLSMVQNVPKRPNFLKQCENNGVTVLEVKTDPNNFGLGFSTPSALVLIKL